MASTTTIQNMVDSVRVYADLEPVFPVGGSTQRPAIDIANYVMQKFLAEGLNWKFNRANVTPFLTVPLQQDYVTSVTDLSWLEQGWRIDINNTAVPKPIFLMESVRDLPQSSRQAVPFFLSWVPNSLAILGKWKADTVYPCSYGQAFTVPSPIQQFLDANGNLLYINSNTLELSIDTPGYGATDFVAPTAPYGTSGAVEPVLPASSAAGATVADGTVTWTVADPNGVAIRLVGLPPTSGVAWLIAPVYQKKPPQKTSLQNTFTPIPDEQFYLIQQGFLARARYHANQRNASEELVQWEAAIVTALRSGDRERDNTNFHPSQGLMSTGGLVYGSGISPAWPFDGYGGW